MACKHCNGPVAHHNARNANCRVNRAQDAARADGFAPIGAGAWVTALRDVDGVELRAVLSGIDSGGPGKRAKDRYTTWAPDWVVATIRDKTHPMAARIALLRRALTDAELHAAVEAVAAANESPIAVLHATVAS